MFGLAALLALGLGIPGTAISADVPGMTRSSVAVGDTGAANVSIPITVPPGVAGVQPSLSLAYKSRGHIDMLGVGWSLAGLSAIHRCPKTTAQDGMPREARGISFTRNDRFCLDGQRSTVIAGAYGAPNSEYRTEIDGISSVSMMDENDASLAASNAANTEALRNFGNISPGIPSEIEGAKASYFSAQTSFGAQDRLYKLDRAGFSRIKANGTKGDGPAFFTVETSSGETREFRDITDSTGKAAPFWAVTKMTDTSGNSMTFTYGRRNALPPNCKTTPSPDTRDMARSELGSTFWIEKIAYGANAGAKTGYVAEVRFCYEGRPDKRAYFQAGIPFQSNLRLKAIETFVKGDGAAIDQKVKTYRIAYERTVSPSTRRSRVAAITECDARKRCYRPHKFAYDGKAVDFTKDDITNRNRTSLEHWRADKRRVHVLDHNGDGLSDFLLQGRTKRHSGFLLTSAGTVRGNFTIRDLDRVFGLPKEHLAVTERLIHILDHNGDGMSDVLLQGAKDDQE